MWALLFCLPCRVGYRPRKVKEQGQAWVPRDGAQEGGRGRMAQVGSGVIETGKEHCLWLGVKLQCLRH